MKKPALYFLILFSALLIFNGCKKETGPAGPAGSANVTSTLFNIDPWNYTTSSYNHYYVNLAVPQLTSANINTAAVMIYINFDGVWTALPYTQYNEPSNYIMGFNTSVGNVELTWIYDGLSAGVDPNDYYNVVVQCKVVVIPPVALQANPDLDITNYEEVENRFNL